MFLLMLCTFPEPYGNCHLRVTNAIDVSSFSEVEVGSTQDLTLMFQMKCGVCLGVFGEAAHIC